MVMENEQEQRSPKNNYSKKIKIEFNVWWLVGVLVLIIVALIGMWRPWQGRDDANRTVTVTGVTTIKAVPDEYSFNPSWQFKNDDRAAALQEATTKSSAVVAELKKIGVANEKITTNLGGWEGYYFYDSSSGDHTYTLTIAVVVSNKDVAQKVQDYLMTTNPTGQVTPSATFSQAKQKKLESDARTAATKEARAKAEQMAKNLKFTIGRVKSINDQNNVGGRFYMTDSASSLLAENASGTEKGSLSVQPGENSIDYSVEVTYYIH